MLADADSAIRDAYGVKRMLLGMTKRITFVIDSADKVAARFHHELSADRHVQDVIGFLKANRK